VRRPSRIVTVHFRSLVPVVVCLIVGLSAGMHAKDLNPPRIRPLDPSLTFVVDAGRHRSPTFHALVQRLEAGDVVVYLQYGQLPDGIHGRLTFLSAVAGYRYVMVEVVRQLDTARLIAIVGHELQHALEILEQPQIVDLATFARAYERSGIKRRYFAEGGVGFDTAAAVLAGRQVWREVGGSAVSMATR
jgi:hypothetical protein